MDKPVHELQDTNDRFLANIQRNGTFSVVPRVAGGEITPDKLIVIGQVAKKYNLYCKITGGQRIDMFGAKKQDLLAIWTELVEGGMESGHAYAKALRTVKVCKSLNDFYFFTNASQRAALAPPGVDLVWVTVLVWLFVSKSDTKVSEHLINLKVASLVVLESAQKHRAKSKLREFFQSPGKD